MAKMDIVKKKCVTPEGRVSFPAVTKPKAFQDQEPKYSLTLLFPKKTDLSKLKLAAENACTEKWGDDRKKWPKNLRTPFRDGDDREDTPGYEGHIFITASSKTQPGLVNQSLQPILNETEFYAGCYARAELLAFAYDTAGNRGVSFLLQNIQKLRDGQPFSGRKAAADVFEAVEDSSDDESSYADTDLGNDADSLGF